MDKEDVLHICSGIRLSHKEEWNLALCSNMDASRDYHTKRSQTEKRHMSYDITHMWNLKYGRHELIYERETNSRTWRIDLWLPRRRVGRDWEFGISWCKLLCIGWVNNKVTLYSIGNYIQYPVISQMEKQIYIYIYTHIYIYVYESLCCTLDINTAF